MQEEEEPIGIGQALEELDEIGDPELEAIQERIVEKRFGWGASTVLVVVVVVVSSAVFGWVMRGQISRLPRLTEEDARALADTLRTASELPPHRRRALVGRALGRVEQERIPTPLSRALVDGGRQAEHTRLLSLRRALAHPDVRPLWQDMCPAELDLEKLASEPKSGTRVFELCDLHRLELLSASHVVTSNADEVLAAHAIMKHLHDHDALTDVERRALGELARGSVAATPALPFQ